MLRSLTAAAAPPATGVRGHTVGRGSAIAPEPLSRRITFPRPLCGCGSRGGARWSRYRQGNDVDRRIERFPLDITVCLYDANGSRRVRRGVLVRRPHRACRRGRDRRCRHPIRHRWRDHRLRSDRRRRRGDTRRAAAPRCAGEIGEGDDGPAATPAWPL